MTQESLNLSHSVDYWQRVARLGILRRFSDLPEFSSGDLVVVKGRLGTGKTLVANALGEILSLAKPPQPVVLNLGGWLREKGVRNELYVKQFRSQLEFLGEMGILVYQTLVDNQLEELIEAQCRLMICPKLSQHTGSITLLFRRGGR